MTTFPALAHRGARRWRDNLPWVLAAVLGVATIHAAAGTLHDTSQRRAAALMVTRSVAERLGADAAHRMADHDATVPDAFRGAIATFDGASPGHDLVRLDERSVEVRDASGRTLFGQLDSARRFQASIDAEGQSTGLTIVVALAHDQIAGPLIAPISSSRMYHLGIFMLATTIALVVAGRASRRETQAARARSDFVAGVSHELRMPLAQILLASETLVQQRERNEADRARLATSILREARRLTGLVENVLLFSRSGSVELRPRLEPVAVDELMVDVVEAVQLAVDDAGQSIAAVPASGIRVTGDRQLLRQALVNLVDNAIKYGAPGQCITLTAAPARPGQVQLIVEDAGRGVPSAERARMFLPYERLERDQESERTGTGLGLAIVRQIARACGGEVILEEGAGGGTRAVIELRAAALPEVVPVA